MTIWAAIFWYFAGPVITLNIPITASDYVGILGDLVHPVVKMFRNNEASFQDDRSPTHSQLEELSFGVRSMKMHFNIFPGHHNRQTEISSNHCGQCQRAG